MTLGAKKLLAGVAIAIPIVVAVDAWFPALHLHLYNWGLLEPTRIDGKQIRMVDGWYELANSKSGVGRIFFSSERETIWLAKAEWPRYGRTNNLIVRKMQLNDIALHKRFREQGQVPPSIKEIKKYPWGTVLFGIDGTTAVVADHWFFLSDEDAGRFRQAVDEISGIN